MTPRCCTYREGLHMKGAVLVLIAGILLGAVLWLGLVGIVIGVDSAGTYMGYGAAVAAAVFLLGTLLWTLALLARAIGRRNDCDACLRDGTPSQFTPWVGRTQGTPSDPDQSVIRLRSTLAKTPADQEERKWES